MEAIEQIEEYVGKIDRSDFMGDSMRQDAVVRQLEVVGEASRQLSESFREEHDAIPWHAIIGMRNRIAHDYLDVDLEVVWDVVRHDLPDLKQEVRSMLEA